MKQNPAWFKVASATRIAIQCLAMAIIILLYGCSERSLIPVDVKDRNLNFSFLDTASYKIVPLETLEESRVGNVDQVLFEDDRIFIFDFSVTFSVNIFSSSGNYLSRIFSVGDGEGEYGSSRLAFDLDRERKEIMIYDVVARKIIRYSFNGEYLRENSLVDFRGTDFAYLGNDSYAFWMSSEDEYQIFITDSTGTVLKKHNPIPEKYSYLISLIPGFFSKGEDNKVHYIPIWEDKIYQITDDNIELKLDLGFSRQIVSSTDEIDLLESNRTQDKFSCFYAFIINEEGQFVASIRHLGDYYGETLGIPIHLFGNISTDIIEAGKLTTSVADFRKYGLGIGYPVGQKGDYFVRAVSPEIVRSVYPDEFGYLNASDNPCLFFYKIKL